jgi:dCTP deaminase
MTSQSGGVPESSPLSNVHLARRLTLPPGDDGRLVINPLVDVAQVGTTTIDLRLGTEWEALRSHRFHALDPGADPELVNDLLNASVEEFRLAAGQRQGLVLHPGELLLAQTLEYLRLPNDLWGQLEGRSTWARVGLQVHATAGMVDCGFSGYLTLELQNTGRVPLVLYPGLRVAQMAFFPVTALIVSYGQKAGAAYSGQSRARSAFTKQPEHRIRNAYVDQQLNDERARVAEKTTPSESQSAALPEGTSQETTQS